MNEDAINKLLEDHLPTWAIGRAHSVLMIGAQLPTRDGRRTGNAHIIDGKHVVFQGHSAPTLLYSVLTDAGTELTLTRNEVEELFYPPQWVSDVAEVLRKFQRKE